MPQSWGQMPDTLDPAGWVEGAREMMERDASLFLVFDLFVYSLAALGPSFAEHGLLLQLW